MRIKNRKPQFRGPRRAIREHRINEEINEPQVRLVTDNGAEVVSSSEALNRAKQEGVDLVEIAKSPDMPIVKIIDYGKFKFEKTKKEKENKKRQKVIQVKEIKVGPKIDVGDFDRKCQLAAEFLNEGDNVKVSMRFRGREMAHTDIGLEKMNQFYENLQDIAMQDKNPSMEGRIMVMVLRPRSKSEVKPKGGETKEDAQSEKTE
ncbi:MAG: translation initiation factor IF-3 [Leptospiraceae bacterium]|nr:translation initiation factor IF-3 [Leptospiraceae bacterium]